MKKVVVAIFAHPDDEAFGPGGTLALLSQEYDVHVICATRGDAGRNNSEDARHIADIRSEELERACKVLGVKKVHFLDYKDGTLNNLLYHEIADKIEVVLNTLQPTILLTYEPRGVSGHLDHVAMSMITSFVFERRSHAQELWYFCISEAMAKELSRRDKPYFIYMPPGYKAEEITKAIDITTVLPTKLAAMKEHTSQWKDISEIRPAIEKFPQECFIIKSKTC